MLLLGFVVIRECLTDSGPEVTSQSHILRAYAVRRFIPLS